ncbi:ABC transporter substrate-binding protein [Clostridium beijerinckii]|uniref:ABC transporter substrate-binding protein n=1 Tax=Clostridium beijerinckii TaxID=1520 RepID=UPI0014942B15|nr:ABC transporter substrate-binding protein [Clostridium beijerinckii]NOW06655.1 putative aldouronate transport system substrate-binding protein [Clostridium beijerinckii]NYC00201.1 putative aldouronate transport system substrate-binding protein [Clostridium beijerinckii]
MKIRRILLTMISFTLIAALILGCGNIEGEQKSKNATSSSEIDKSPVTLTFFDVDAIEDMQFDDEVAKKITELTGVTLKITHPVPGDTQAISLMIASGDYPDLIFAKGDTGKLIDAGAIIKLDDYIEKSGNNIKELYGDKLNRLRHSQEDPSTYTVGTYGVKTQVFDPNGTMQLQHALLKELGYPEIKTLQDYERAIKEYIAKYPEINGKKTIGMSLMASDWRWLITCGNVASAVAGIPNDGQFKIDDEAQKATYKFQLPEVKEYFKWLNHMNAEGLLDPESFTQKEETYLAKLSQGNVLGITDAKWDYDTSIKKLVSSGMDERTFAPLAVTLGEKYKSQELREYGYGGGWGVAISSTSKNKDRAFQFLNWLASDEAQVLLNWGIEGKHYKIENGKRVMLPEVQEARNTDKDFKNRTGIGQYIYPFPQRGNAAIDSSGNPYASDTLDVYVANYNKGEKATLEGYGKKSFLEFFPSAEELGKSKHGQQWQYNISTDSDIAVIQKKADDYTQKAITQSILGRPEDFEAAWEKIQKDLRAMNIEKLNEEMSKVVSEKIKLWND